MTLKQHPTIPRLVMDESGGFYLSLSPHSDDSGYLQLTVTLEGVSRCERVHRLVWEVVNGRPVPSGLMVRHLNDVKRDNRPCNLALGTHRDNMEDRTRNGGDTAGSANGQAKLTEESVRAIRRRVASGESRATVAAEYGIGRSALADVVRGRTWKHVTDTVDRNSEQGEGYGVETDRQAAHGAGDQEPGQAFPGDDEGAA
jgi:hypothetical protein